MNLIMKDGKHNDDHNARQGEHKSGLDSDARSRVAPTGPANALHTMHALLERPAQHGRLDGLVVAIAVVGDEWVGRGTASVFETAAYKFSKLLFKNRLTVEAADGLHTIIAGAVAPGVVLAVAFAVKVRALDALN